MPSHELIYSTTELQKMKKILFTLSIICLTTLAFGQITAPDSTKRELKNVIGIDATGVLRQVFNFSTSSYYPYNPYIITYKRILKSNAIRSGIGGNISNSNGTANDSIKNKQKNYIFNLALGFEHYAYLSKRWNLFLGIDAIMNYRYNNYENSYTMTTKRMQTSTTIGYGISPVFGVQFKINSRISLSTETSYDITYSTTNTSSSESPQTNYNYHSKSDNLLTNFHAPLTVNFRILF